MLAPGQGRDLVADFVPGLNRIDLDGHGPAALELAARDDGVLLRLEGERIGVVAGLSLAQLEDPGNFQRRGATGDAFPGRRRIAEA